MSKSLDKFELLGQSSRSPQSECVWIQVGIIRYDITAAPPTPVLYLPIFFFYIYIYINT